MLMREVSSISEPAVLAAILNPLIRSTEYIGKQEIQQEAVETARDVSIAGECFVHND